MKSCLDFSIAGISGRITLEDARLQPWLSSVFATYRSHSAPLFQVFISGSCSELKTAGASPHGPVFVERSDNRFAIVECTKLQEHIQLGSIDPESLQFCIPCLDGFDCSKLLSVIRVCFHFVLEAGSGFFLHASSGTLRGKTVAFTGKSGAGKTTALTNLKPDAVVSEDAAAIRTDGSSVRIFSTPFRREKRAMGRIDAILFPKKTSSDARVLKKSMARAIAGIASNTLFVSPYDPDQAGKVMDSIVRFCATVPAFDLYFKKRDSLESLPEMIV